MAEVNPPEGGRYVAESIRPKSGIYVAGVNPPEGGLYVAESIRLKADTTLRGGGAIRLKADAT